MEARTRDLDSVCVIEREQWADGPPHELFAAMRQACAPRGQSGRRATRKPIGHPQTFCHIDVASRVGNDRFQGVTGITIGARASSGRFGAGQEHGFRRDGELSGRALRHSFPRRGGACGGQSRGRAVRDVEITAS